MDYPRTRRDGQPAQGAVNVRGADSFAMVVVRQVLARVESLAQELAPYGVLVNVVALGPTDTSRVLAPGSREAWKPLIPMGRTG